MSTRIQAVLVDVYRTLLAVLPPPPDAPRQWEELCRSTLPREHGPSLAQFDAASRAAIAREHDRARAVQVAYPEVFWPSVACEAWPALGGLGKSTLDAFLYAHARLQRGIALMEGAAEVLHHLAGRQVPVGLVSNCQPYTLHELEATLAPAGLHRSLFATDLSFLSFENGFSKPDPHVFRLLAARLARRGWAPGEVLMVGDRMDNDIEPARAQGFQTWRFEEKPGDQSGPWRELAAVLAG